MKKIGLILGTMLLLICTLTIFASAESLSVTKVSVAGSNKNAPITKVAMKEAFKASDTYNYFKDGIFSQKVTVTLSNGKSYTFSSASSKKIGNYTLSVAATISKSVYENAVENKSKTIPVSVKCVIKDNSVSDIWDVIKSASGNNKVTKTLKINKELVNRYVKSITPVSGIPKSVYDGADYYELEGACFNVVYYSGSEIEATCELADIDDKGIRTYSIDGKTLKASVKNGAFNFTYLDSPVATEAVTVKTKVYTKLKITDCSFSENGLEYVAYTLTKYSGKTEKVIYNCSNYTTAKNQVPNLLMKSQYGYNFFISDSDPVKGISTDSSRNVVCISVAGLSDSYTADVVQKTETEEETTTATYDALVTLVSIFKNLFSALMAA